MHPANGDAMAQTYGTAGDLIVRDATDPPDRFRIAFLVAGDEPGAVSLPIDCLEHLVVTLPRIAAAALRAGRQDARACDVSCTAGPGSGQRLPRLAASQDVAPN